MIHGIVRRSRLDTVRVSRQAGRLLPLRPVEESCSLCPVVESCSLVSKSGSPTARRSDTAPASRDTSSSIRFGRSRKARFEGSLRQTPCAKPSSRLPEQPIDGSGTHDPKLRQLRSSTSECRAPTPLLDIHPRLRYCSQCYRKSLYDRDLATVHSGVSHPPPSSILSTTLRPPPHCMSIDFHTRRL